MDNASTHSKSADPRLSRATNRPSIITSHESLLQVATPAERPSSSRVLDFRRNVDQVPSQGLSTVHGGVPNVGNRNDTSVKPSPLVSIFLELSELAATKALQEKEKVILLEENASIKQRLEKAKSRDAFAITIENAQAEEAASQAKLRKVQFEIDQAETSRRQVACSVEKSLRGMFAENSGLDPSSALVPFIPRDEDEKVAKLEAENQEIKAELQDIKERLWQQRVESPHGLQSSISRIEKSVNSQVMSNQGINKRLRKLEEWRECMEDGAAESSLRLAGKSLDLEPLQNDVKVAHGKAIEAQKRAEAMGDRLSILQRDIAALRNSIDLYSPSRQNFDKTMKSAELILQQIPDFKSRLEKMENDREELKHATTDATREFETKIRELDSRFVTFRQSHDAKIHLIESGIRQGEGTDNNSQSNNPQNSETPGFLKTAVEKLEHNHRLLLNTVNKLLANTPRVQKCLAVFEALVAAVRSLELRYSNINSEHLVKNMASAMTEMYPSMPQALEQLNQLKAHCTQEIATLKSSEKQHYDCLDSKLDRIHAGIETKLEHLQKNVKELGDGLKEQLEDTWDIKNKFQTHSDAFSELADSLLEAQGQMEKVNEASAAIAVVTTQVRNLEHRVGGENIMKETLTQSSTGKEIPHVGIDGSSSIYDALDKLTANYQDLESRIKQQGEAVSVESAKLTAECSRIASSWDQVRLEFENGQDSDQITELSQKIQALLSDVHSLQIRLDNEVKLIIGRMDGMASAGDLSLFKSEALSRFEKLGAALSASWSDPLSAREHSAKGPPQDPSVVSGSIGDDYRILGNAAREPNQSSLKWLRERPASSHSSSSMPEVFGNNSVAAVDDSPRSPFIPGSPSTDAPSLPAPRPFIMDLPIAFRISEEDRTGIRQDHRSPLVDGSRSPKAPKSQLVPTTRTNDSVAGNSESGPSRKRPRQGTFSDDGGGSWTSTSTRTPNVAKSSNENESSLSKKARKKLEKRERKEQRKRQKGPMH
ncbi:hypothetical protein PDE_04568 [Penicillium oxalicum 114-2]|uniref:Uncharacterized protein n=1 Tax=Penicillium oxalicum (strain 114-2 / CGMCC 5302) TaxID=933388 RepID=S8ATZ0_PENO1|nr:hypothetical protein PDE_04568 [Penicillium oxalicum 114-2]